MRLLQRIPKVSSRIDRHLGWDTKHRTPLKRCPAQNIVVGKIPGPENPEESDRLSTSADIGPPIHSTARRRQSRLNQRGRKSQGMQRGTRLKIKTILTSTPSLQRLARKVKSALSGGTSFTSSANYWEDRYRQGGTSGAGSYDRLAEFKAQVLNTFVRENNIRSVIEFGSGDGAQLELADYPDYTGIDVSTTAIETTRRRFAGNGAFRFLHSSEVTDDLQADLVLSLDVIYHLVEDEVFNDYMKQLFAASSRWVIIYASNESQPHQTPHVRHREFTRWIDANEPGFRLVHRIPNVYPYSADDPDHTSFADFYIFEMSPAAG